MNKDKRSHKRRHLKKLRLGEWHQQRIEIRFNHTLDFGVGEELDQLIDDCYDIAENLKCFLFGNFDKESGLFAFHNNGKLTDLAVAEIAILDKLKSYGCQYTGIKVVDYE